MRYSLVFDFGTTAVKGMLIDLGGYVIREREHLIDTRYSEDRIEQSAEDHFDAFRHLMKELLPEKIDESVGLIMSGQMQDLILVDESGSAISDMILYSDTRAISEAEEILEALGEEDTNSIIRNLMNASLPAAKLKWLSNNKSNLLKETRKILFSPKDYVVYKISGKAILDYTNASTTGVMNFDNLEYSKEILEYLGVNKEILPELSKATRYLGDYIWEDNNQRLSLYAGIGDAGAATYASGVQKPGQFNIHIGTTGWISMMTENPLNPSGNFQLRDYSGENVIITAPFFNAGNVHKWATGVFADGDYALAEDIMNFENELFFLPYLTGERYPVLDSEIRGAYYGITPDTDRSDMLGAALESVCFSIRQGIEKMSDNVETVSVIGGGARSGKWMQLLSDTLQTKIEVYEKSEFLPSLSLAGLVFEERGSIKDSQGWLSGIRHSYFVEPMKMSADVYKKYERYKKFYPTLKAFID